MGLFTACSVVPDALACAEWGSGLCCPISHLGPNIKKEKHSNLQKTNPPFQTPAGSPVLTGAGVLGRFGTL